MAETPNPTNDQFFDTLKLNVGRESAVQKEVVRRLELNMADKIAYINDLLGYSSGKGIPVPKSYLPAPSSVLSDDYLNSILVSAAVATSTNGVRTFKQEIQVVVYSVDRRIEHHTQVESYLDRAAIATAILLSLMDSGVNPEAPYVRNADNQIVWHILTATGRQLSLPQGWADSYSGSTAYFTVIQDSSCQCWG